MMEVSEPGGLGEQGLLDSPPAAQKKKPKYMYFTHTPHNTHLTHTTQHTHNCKCTLPISTPNTGTDITGEGIDQNNKDSPDRITSAKDKDNLDDNDNFDDNDNEDVHLNDNDSFEDNDNFDDNVVDDNYNLEGNDSIVTESEREYFPNLSNNDQRNQDREAAGPPAVREFRDIFPFHDRFLQQLDDRHRWVLYRVNFSDSPDRHFDTTCEKTWDKEAGPQEMTRLNKRIYELLQEAFQDFAPGRPIFWRHRVEHPLSASRV
jgi:hypothetical protein